MSAPQTGPVTAWSVGSRWLFFTPERSSKNLTRHPQEQWYDSYDEKTHHLRDEVIWASGVLASRCLLDDVVTSISQAMPKLLAVRLAHHCLNLPTLRVHLQVVSLSDPSAVPGRVSRVRPTASWPDCALVELEVEELLLPQDSAMTIATTLLHIPPRLDSMEFIDIEWEDVEHVLRCSKEITDCSSK